MASYLGALNNRPSSTKRNAKFIRSVNSFLKQTYENKELIIVSDGCPITYQIYMENWIDNPLVECIMIEKQELYSGKVRLEGIKEATGDIICYLDNDDMIGKNHIETIVKQFDTNEVQWVYYDDYLVLSSDFKQLHLRDVSPNYGSIGTSSIAHINHDILKDKQLFTDGYGHDFLAMMKLVGLGWKFKKLEETPKYLVCRWGDVPPKGGDF